MRLRRLDSLHAYLCAAVPILLVVFVWMYGLFLWGSISEFDERCSHGIEYDGAPFVEMRHSYVPMENACVFEDGTVVGGVPWAYNLVAFGALGGAGASAVAAVRLGRRIDRVSAAASPG
ncbi:hypothetical protein [Jiangella alkaliphila]|uniref:Uncharacterized protein n=1 Tax=Jiangella alkaliphila TaxID=419479 RepID=A0A1H2LPN0_9ACTN|nr:hypothetical protein [Jiangella alkaliphila]SDU82715.1 hypothetical protein SAMN04488563_6453 [Jiangella alkaliphila]